MTDLNVETTTRLSSTTATWERTITIKQGDTVLGTFATWGEAEEFIKSREDTNEKE